MNPALAPIMGWWKGEKEGTLRMIQAIPPDKMHEKPVERFRSAAALAGHLIDMHDQLVPTFEKGELFFGPPAELPDTVEALAERYRKSCDAAIALAENLTEEQLFKKYPMEMDGEVMWEPNGLELISGYICHEIHHRGQLSLLIRMLGGTVPGVYGPSGDEWDGE